MEYIEDMYEVRHLRARVEKDHEALDKAMENSTNYLEKCYYEAIYDRIEEFVGEEYIEEYIYDSINGSEDERDHTFARLEALIDEKETPTNLITMVVAALNKEAYMDYGKDFLLSVFTGHRYLMDVIAEAWGLTYTRQR